MFALSLAAKSHENTSPIEEYLTELDEMGRTLCRWKGEDQVLESWFFSSYAMLIMQNYGAGDLNPFPTMERIVPPLWSDFKNLNPRYLIELAGGALAFGDVMSVGGVETFSDKRAEEQFILVVSGYSYLRMLQGTVGDSLFTKIVRTATASNTSFEDIEQSLVHSISTHYDPWVSHQFMQVLSSGEWLDAEIGHVRRKDDSLVVSVDFNGSWAFPVDVLVITKSNDSTLVQYMPEGRSALRIPSKGVDRIILDPTHKLAEYFRYNNEWPQYKKKVYIQPFAALPDWEHYRITVSPVSWSDWDGDKRYGLKFTSGFGVDLWPAYPSDYRHRASWEFNVHDKLDEPKYWGGRVSYANTINRKERLFSFARLHSYSDWRGGSVGITKYLGDQSFLVQGTRLKYHRIKLSIESDTYQDTAIWERNQRVNLINAGYSGLSITRFGDRLLLSIQTALGKSESGTFSIIKSNADLSAVFWKKIVTGIQMVAGSQSPGTSSPYQFTHDYVWQDNLAAIPNFRGQTKLTHPTNNYIGVSVDGGYWYSGLQVKIFASSMIFDSETLPLNESRPHHAFGFGFEHKSFFTMGLFFPIWQSHPLAGEEPWAWRYRWRLTWNL
ncbi:MAG: hypothetical protein K9M49_03315 [Candidatus Marinimicrobia bacterium]|nr:hypothetical protein [Candidatus Neomarinimicrobiota bacterium]MCF7850884.1 hypothetical protein [Candidatus Neomarinimicrobiota bacterium]MCF7904163.1 hypothetical protein [Candidatus Neomarinimicrobiota bacterium]